MINSRKELGDALYTDEQVEILNDHLAQETMAAVMGKTDVQLLVQHMQDSIREVIQPLHFEINDQYTRSAAVATMHGIMAELHIRDHVYDYAVVCDETNNTPRSVDRGELALDVYFKTKLFKDPIRVRGRGMSSVSAAIDSAISPQQKQSNNSNPVYGANAGGFITIQPGSAAIGNMANQITGSQFSYTASNAGLTLNMPDQKQTADLPPMIWDFKDDAGAMCKMELKPEGTIGAHEALQLMMLIQASSSSPLSFSSYMYVKKHNLEKHFKFSS